MMNSSWCGSKGDGKGRINWLSWDKLCIRKEHGRLGFRNLQGFNLAMLAKATNYPRGEFLSANIGHNPSFTWRSIWSARVETPMLPFFRELKVHDLRIPGSKEWDIKMLQEIFNDRDVREISSILVEQGTVNDQLIWHFSIDGRYTVKSGYQ
ncbi:conserved hypothetical protein [Ricinus communis]|uniref:Reverse transcriptase zinc-binding domain-containing protein n=1 Tax=Ricinus communis TaxID=3988 RepID=B9SUN6_RICCO|nr:conserved hypothetical protein [Ricinus communis]